jgi:hypothetical protein
VVHPGAAPGRRRQDADRPALVRLLPHGRPGHLSHRAGRHRPEGAIDRAQALARGLVKAARPGRRPGGAVPSCHLGDYEDCVEDVGNGAGTCGGSPGWCSAGSTRISPRPTDRHHLTPVIGTDAHENGSGFCCHAHSDHINGYAVCLILQRRFVG